MQTSVTKVTNTFQNLKFQSLVNTTQGFLRWWLSQLIGLVPERLRRAVRLDPERWIVELEDSQIRIHRPGGAGVQPPAEGSFSLEGDGQLQSAVFIHLRTRDLETSELILRLPPKRVLRKVVNLPLAVEENLREVLGFEMDQQTPFRAEQVYYDVQILERVPLTQQLRVNLVVVPRRYLDEILDRLAAWGLYPDIVEVAGPTPLTSSINLLPIERRRPRATALLRLNLALATVAVMLLVATAVIPLIQRAYIVEQLQAQVAAVQKQAEAASALRQQLDRLTQQSRFLLEKKASAPLIINVLNELTHLLPDSTWLYQFELNGSEISIQGESSSSSALIGLIEASPLFRNVTYRSPVTQNRVTGSERFNLSAEVVTGVGS